MKEPKPRRRRPSPWPPTRRCPGCGRETGVSSDPAGRCFTCEDLDLVPIGGRLVPVPRQRDLALETKERS